MERRPVPLSSPVHDSYLDRMPGIVTPSLHGVHSALTSPSNLTGPSDRLDDEGNFDDQRSGSVGPQRNPSTATAKGGEKRKRSRVTPEQLEQLERYFATNRSPNSNQRKEISERLGMLERQTQIWFQNRRAKAKGTGVKPADGVDNGESPDARRVEVTPEPWRDSETARFLVHEDAPILIIPSPEIKIGSWKRQACQSDRMDLICYVCESRQCFVWFVNNAGLDFKMEVPFSSICRTQLVHKNSPKIPEQRNATAILTLMQPPIFMIQDTRVAYSDSHRWQRCGDWTEGKQASQTLIHELTGSINDIRYALSIVARVLHPEQNHISLVPPYAHPVSSGLQNSHPVHIPAPLSLPRHGTTDAMEQHRRFPYGPQAQQYPGPSNQAVAKPTNRYESMFSNPNLAMPPHSQSLDGYAPLFGIVPNNVSPSSSFDATPRSARHAESPSEYFNGIPAHVNQPYYAQQPQSAQQSHYNHSFSGMNGGMFDNQYGTGMSI